LEGRYPWLPHSHILRATSRFHHWQGVGPLSIKSFKNGRAYYRTEGGGMFAVDPGSYLILNHAQHYEITIESETPVSSFCVFFAPVAADAALRSLTEQAAALLNDPLTPARGGAHGGDYGAGCGAEFLVRAHASDAAVSPLLERL
jgi:hypothetical protein